MNVLTVKIVNRKVQYFPLILGEEAWNGNTQCVHACVCVWHKYGMWNIYIYSNVYQYLYLYS